MLGSVSLRECGNLSPKFIIQTIVEGKKGKGEKAGITLFIMIETQALCHKRDVQFNHINNINNFSVNNNTLK